MQEIVNKRTYTQKVYDNGDGTQTLKAHVGHIHYKDEQDQFADVDLTLEDKGAYWEMRKHNYRLRVHKDFGANQLIQYTNRYKGANHTIVYEPHSLRWVNNPDLSDMQMFRTQQSVQGVYNAQNGVVRYEGAFGFGIDFEITIGSRGFKKEVIIQAKNALELPPTPQHKLGAFFRFQGDGLNVLKRNGEKWNEQDFFESDNGFEFEEVGVAKSFVRPAVIEDSGVDQKQVERIKVFWRKHNGSLWQAKVLPKQFLQNATYPVRADTTTDYDSGTGDGTCYNNVSTPFLTLREQSSSDVVYTGGTYLQAAYWSSKYRLGRVFYPVDTSGIPDTATVTSANLNVAMKANSNYRDSILVETTQASGTALATSDFGTVNITSYNQISASISGSGWTTDTMRSIPLTDVSVVNKTGYTKMAFIDEDYDAGGVTPSDNKWIELYTDANGGASYQPYLEVTYTAAASSSIKSINGVTQANIKSVKGVTNANTKSILGVSNV